MAHRPVHISCSHCDGFDGAGRLRGLALERARTAISKRKLRVNADTQLLEDIAGLVFIEYYMLAFAEKHPEYDEDKWIDIIRKTWNKMTADAHTFALSGKLKLPESLVPLIQKSVAD